MTVDSLFQRARQNGAVRRAWRKIQRFRLPLIRPLAAALYAERTVRMQLWPILLRIFYREPLLRYRCASVGSGLRLEGSLPLIFGDGRIELGSDCTIGARNTWTVGFKVSRDATLIVGDRVSINYQVILSVAKRVEIGNDTLIAGNCQIYDNISHPLSASRRLANEQFALDESSPVIIGKNVWIGSNSIIMRGVTIGDNSVVAAASVVTKSVPANSLVAGNPAVLIKSIPD